MSSDLLNDVEREEFYKKKLKNNTGKLIVFCNLCFILGFVVARYYYTSK